MSWPNWRQNCCEPVGGGHRRRCPVVLPALILWTIAVLAECKPWHIGVLVGPLLGWASLETWMHHRSRRFRRIIVQFAGLGVFTFVAEVFTLKVVWLTWGPTFRPRKIRCFRPSRIWPW